MVAVVAAAGLRVLSPQKLPVNAVRPLLVAPRISYLKDDERAAGRKAWMKPNDCSVAAGKARQM